MPVHSRGHAQLAVAPPSAADELEAHGPWATAARHSSRILRTMDLRMMDLRMMDLRTMDLRMMVILTIQELASSQSTRARVLHSQV